MVHQDTAAIGNNAATLASAAPIATRKNCRSKAIFLQHASQQDCQGRFPGAADSQITDADHRAGKFFGPQRTLVIKKIPHANGKPVRNGQDPEQER
jgi:hypothetical protein